MPVTLPWAPEVFLRARGELESLERRSASSRGTTVTYTGSRLGNRAKGYGCVGYINYNSFELSLEHYSIRGCCDWSDFGFTILNLKSRLMLYLSRRTPLYLHQLCPGKCQSSFKIQCTINKLTDNQQLRLVCLV